MFPSLVGHGMIAFDLETKDEDLRERGPGYHRSDTFIAGLAVATEAGFRHYYPMRHEGGDNLDPTKVMDWFRNQAAIDVPKVGSNISYDLGFLEQEDVRPVGPFYDTQIAEPLLNENRFQYGIGALSLDYLGVGKNDDEMDEYLQIKFGKKNPKRYIWRAPGDLVGPYAVADADRSMRVFLKQQSRLQAENLWPLFTLETKLLPMLLAMRRRGVRVDIGRAEEMDQALGNKLTELIRRMRDYVREDVEVWSAQSVARAFDSLGMTDYPRTAKTRAPSFTSDWFEKCPHPLAEIILEARRIDKLRGTFIRGQILNSAYRGRVHCQFNQLRGEGRGAVSGRLSAERPNLQFIPQRTTEGKKIREVFLPDHGESWGKTDYSQIEYRLAVHDAVRSRLRGAADLARMYHEDPNTDMHQVCSDMCADLEVFAGLTPSQRRGKAKTVNFGVIYGEGVEKLSHQLSMTREDCEIFLKDYNSRVPFMRPLAKNASALASDGGVITTLLGRKRRFETWVVKRRVDGKVQDVFLPHRVSGSRRAFTHAALNARIQGSAADVMKKAMVDIWESGVCRVLGPPLITVHDELDWSIPNTTEGREAFAESVRIMENCVSLEVPLRVDAGSGDNWGTAE